MVLHRRLRRRAYSLISISGSQPSELSGLRINSKYIALTVNSKYIALTVNSKYIDLTAGFPVSLVYPADRR